MLKCEEEFRVCITKYLMGSWRNSEANLPLVPRERFERLYIFLAEVSRFMAKMSIFSASAQT
jgi:hypothetical protein